MATVKMYYKDGSVLSYFDRSKILHREDGPAVERSNRTREWWFNGRRHRIDGPAVEWDIPHSEHGGWFIDGKSLSEEQFKRMIEEVKQLPLELKLTDPREWVRNL